MFERKQVGRHVTFSREKMSLLGILCFHSKTRGSQEVEEISSTVVHSNLMMSQSIGHYYGDATIGHMAQKPLRFGLHSPIPCDLTCSLLVSTLSSPLS